MKLLHSLTLASLLISQPSCAYIARERKSYDSLPQEEKARRWQEQEQRMQRRHIDNYLWRDLP